MLANILEEIRRDSHDFRNQTCGDCVEPVYFAIDKHDLTICTDGGTHYKSSIHDEVDEGREVFYCRETGEYVENGCPACRHFQPSEVPK